MNESVLMEELEVLESIYMEDLIVERDYRVCIQLHPATGDDVHKKYVCITLVLDIPQKYPDELPEVTLKNPRGLGEDEVISLKSAMLELAEDRQGGHMLYDMIELVKENLTQGNVPRCACTICYEHFTEVDSFLRTNCYHFFHVSCLERYVRHVLEMREEENKDIPAHSREKNEESDKVPCPVCREEIQCDKEQLRRSMSVEEEPVVYTPTPEMVQWQKDMAELHEKQKKKGGIIDIEEEKNKFLVTRDTVFMPVSVSPVPKDTQKSETNDKNAAPNIAVKERQGKGRGQNKDRWSNREDDRRYRDKDRVWKQGDRYAESRQKTGGRDGGDRRPGSGRQSDRSVHTKGQVLQYDQRDTYDKTRDRNRNGPDGKHEGKRPGSGKYTRKDWIDGRQGKERVCDRMENDNEGKGFDKKEKDIHDGDGSNSPKITEGGVDERSHGMNDGVKATTELPDKKTGLEKNVNGGVEMSEERKDGKEYSGELENSRINSALDQKEENSVSDTKSDATDSEERKPRDNKHVERKPKHDDVKKYDARERHGWGRQDRRRYQNDRWYDEYNRQNFAKDRSDSGHENSEQKRDRFRKPILSNENSAKVTFERKSDNRGGHSRPYSEHKRDGFGNPKISSEKSENVPNEGKMNVDQRHSQPCDHNREGSGTPRSPHETSENFENKSKPDNHHRFSNTEHKREGFGKPKLGKEAKDSVENKDRQDSNRKNRGDHADGRKQFRQKKEGFGRPKSPSEHAPISAQRKLESEDSEENTGKVSEAHEHNETKSAIHEGNDRMKDDFRRQKYTQGQGQRKDNRWHNENYKSDQRDRRKWDGHHHGEPRRRGKPRSAYDGRPKQMVKDGDNVKGQGDEGNNGKIQGKHSDTKDNAPSERSGRTDSEHSASINERSKGVPPGFVIQGPPPGFKVTSKEKVKAPPGFEGDTR